MSPDVQPQAPTTEGEATTGSSSNDSGRRQWLEPAVVVTILALLVSIVFGIYGMNARMDVLSDRMDVLGADINTRMDALNADLNARMNALNADLNARMDALNADLNARMDALSAGLNTRIDNVYQLLFSKENLENIKNGPLQAPDLQS